jgi:hypothetical protein
MYWLVAVALVVFGFLGGFSIGGPFLMLGLVMLVVGPVRHRPRLFWPVIAGVVAFNAGYWAVTPLVCTTTAELGGQASTACTNLLGIRYAGGPDYNPSLVPARIAGLGAGIAAAVVTALLLWRRGEHDVTELP